MAFTIMSDDYEQDRAKTVTYGRTINQNRKNTDSVDNRFPKYKERMNQNIKELGWEIVKYFGEDAAADGDLYDNDFSTPDKETPLADKSDITKDVKSTKEKLSESFVQDVTKVFLNVGGAYGHMNHTFDDNNLTLSEWKNIIIIGVSEQLNRED